jgi:hypothetical protein
VYRGWRAVGFRHPEAGYVCGVFPKGDGRVDLLFEHGATLPDPEGLLQGATRQTRFIPLRSRDDVPAATLAVYVQEAIVRRLMR